jgi:hypothetical protein
MTNDFPIPINMVIHLFHPLPYTADEGDGSVALLNLFFFVVRYDGLRVGSGKMPVPLPTPYERYMSRWEMR